MVNLFKNLFRFGVCIIMNEVYTIIDIDAYADTIRQEAALELSNGGKTNDIDDFIKVSETISIVADHSLGLDEDGYHIIDSETHSAIMDDVSNWIFNIGLAKLAASNQLECAWDDDSNEMVFWKKDANMESKSYDTKTDHRDQTRN